MANSTPLPHPQSIPPGQPAKFDTEAPRLGFIVAAALSDGDVIGVYRDGGSLELRWVDAQTHDQTPLTFQAGDLSRIAQLLSSAQSVLASEG